MSQVHNPQDDPTLEILYLQSQVHCFQWESTSETLTLGSHVRSLQHDSSKTQYRGSDDDSLHDDKNTQKLPPGSHVHRLQHVPLTDSAPGVTYVQSPG